MSAPLLFDRLVEEIETAIEWDRPAETVLRRVFTEMIVSIETDRKCPYLEDDDLGPALRAILAEKPE